VAPLLLFSRYLSDITQSVGTGAQILKGISSGV